MGARVIFTNVNLVDGDHPAQPGSCVVVEGNRITSVGTSPVDAAETDRVIDLAGRTLMPGMFSSHYHGHGQFGAPAWVAITALKTAEETLLSGFTSAIAAGSPGYVQESIARAINEGIYPGPRITVSSRDLSATANNIDLLEPWYTKNESPFSNRIRCADGPDAFRHAIRDEIAHGAQIVKLLVSGGHGALTPKNRMELSQDELDMAIRTAHESGILIRGHCAGRDVVLNLIKSGIDIVDHGDDLDEEGIEAALEHNTFVAPSCAFPKAYLSSDFRSPKAKFVQEDLDHMMRILPIANEAGVKFLIGDDYSSMVTSSAEMELYVNDAHVPALDVLRWATKHGAEAARRGHDLGTIEEGKLADLVVMNGDPSQDITLFKDNDNILAVMKDGNFAKDDLSRISGV
jgi:imidazolonepropionase-like amidohydrolase